MLNLLIIYSNFSFLPIHFSFFHFNHSALISNLPRISINVSFFDWIIFKTHSKVSIYLSYIILKFYNSNIMFVLFNLFVDLLRVDNPFYWKWFTRLSWEEFKIMKHYLCSLDCNVMSNSQQNIFSNKKCCTMHLMLFLFHSEKSNCWVRILELILDWYSIVFSEKSLYLILWFLYRDLFFRRKFWSLLLWFCLGFVSFHCRYH